ncbi:hypothetical protein [Mahella australiensis]|uniref:Uncharacterized protein n=1 Tax=Mahella australiensis (strain DSM 15567 / CIP 107919 / 50-1 BON) TaxID=697281 RepID=F3ZZF3_MAHA5|nr:hypothetical protein [Mahella australiensis]AEE95763.1 hypothetical protein Mahau_0559 [Mahella australiensis 50-1 BON]
MDINHVTPEEELVEFATDVWLQFGYNGVKDRTDGGLSTLEWAREILERYGLIDENGLFRWERDSNDV